MLRSQPTEGGCHGRPTILTVDDDPQVSAAIGRDLGRQYGTDYRVETRGPVRAVLFDGALAPTLEWVASTISVASLLSEVQESTRRISELVAAVRSYSQVDRASLQRIDVTEGLESTLVVLGHKLREGVTVVRHYDADVPQIEAYPGELNQVWTNLIDNAVDAMDGTGTLEVTTRTDGKTSWSRSATPAPGCHRRWSPAPSRRSTRPRM